VTDRNDLDGLWFWVYVARRAAPRLVWPGGMVEAASGAIWAAPGRSAPRSSGKLTRSGYLSSFRGDLETFGSCLEPFRGGLLCLQSGFNGLPVEIERLPGRARHLPTGAGTGSGRNWRASQGDCRASGMKWGASGEEETSSARRCRASEMRCRASGQRWEGHFR